MGTMVERPRKKGGKSYMAKIIIKREGKVIHRETETFDGRPAAAGWRREEELSKPGAIERAKLATSDPPLSVVIDRYIDESEKEIGRTKAQVLRAIKNYDIANKRCSEITSTDVVALANELIVNVAPSTVGNYLSRLGAVFAVAKPAWANPLDQTAMRMPS